jgi:hypothetical protein
MDRNIVSTWRQSNFFAKFIILILVNMSICLKIFAADRGVNQLLLLVMLLSVPVLFFSKKRINYYDIGFILFWIFSYILAANNYATFRLSTLLYTGIFLLTFLCFLNLLDRKLLNPETYLSLLRTLIYSFFIMLIVQQLCVLVGLPIPNSGQQIAVSKWKLNTLTLESSHAARLMFVFMYSYILINSKLRGKVYNIQTNWREDRYIWISFFWTMATMISSTAIILIIIILLKITKLKNIPNIILIVITSGLFFSILIPEFLINRLLAVIEAILTLQPEKVVIADDSASFRIVPVMVILKNLDISNIQTWLGYGIDYDKILMYKKMGERLGEAGGGGVLTILLNYGLALFALFMFLLFKTSISLKDPFGVVVWILFFSLGGVNTQVFWAIQMFYAANKYFITAIPNNRLTHGA